MVEDNSEIIDAMLKNHSGERDPTSNATTSTQSAAPKASTESLSAHEPEPEYVHGRDNFEETAIAWCEWAIDAHNLPIERSEIEIKADGRLTSAFGNCRARGGDPIMKITRKYDRFADGWGRANETLLHELIHAVQAVWMGWTSHGPTFKQGCRAVGLEHHANREQYKGVTEPKYLKECQNCGMTIKKYRMCKAIRKPNLKGCGGCNTSSYSDPWEVRENRGEHKELLEYWNERV